MFILGNFILAVAQIANTLLTIYFWIIVASAVLSWVNPDPYNPIVSFLRRVTEPVFYRVRRVLPYMGGIDLSPLLILLAIQFLQSFVISSLIGVAYRLKGGAGVFP